MEPEAGSNAAAPPCGGFDNEKDGCQQTFLRGKFLDLLCALCKKLKDERLSQSEKAEIEVRSYTNENPSGYILTNSPGFPQANYTQCATCGVCGTRIKNPCGSCKRARRSSIFFFVAILSLTLTILVHEEKGTNDEDRTRASDLRKERLERTIHRPPSGSGSIAATSISRLANADASGMTTPLQELLNIRSNSGKAGYFTIYHECRRSNAPKVIDRDLGTGCSPYLDQITMLGMCLSYSTSMIL